MSVPQEATEFARQLVTVPLFKNLAPEILGSIIALGRLTPMSAGTFFFNEGDDAERFFVLTRGRVKLTQLTPEGHQVVLGHIGPGDAFGGVGAFGDPSYPVSAETVEPSVALAWTSGTMQHVLETHPTVAINAIRFVADRLHDLQRRYRQLMTERVERRVARALLRLVRDPGRRVDTGVEIDFPVSRQDIAEMTGTTVYGQSAHELLGRARHTQRRGPAHRSTESARARRHRRRLGSLLARPGSGRSLRHHKDFVPPVIHD
jgi:CRP-like cAMP-binding protein